MSGVQQVRAAGRHRVPPGHVPHQAQAILQRGRAERLEGRVRHLSGGAVGGRHHRAPALPLHLPQRMYRPMVRSEQIVPRAPRRLGPRPPAGHQWGTSVGHQCGAPTGHQCGAPTGHHGPCTVIT